MSSTAVINKTYLKAGFSAVSALAIDMALTGNQDMMASVYIALATGVGSLAGGYIGGMIPTVLPSDKSAVPLYTGSSVQGRLFEVLGSYGGITAIERYMPSLNRNDSMAEKLGVATASVALGEIASDYWSNEPVGILN